MLVLITNRQSYMSFRLVRKSVTLNDLERRNGAYLALLLPNLVILGAYCVKVVITKPYYGQFTITMSSSKRLQRDCGAAPTV